MKYSIIVSVELSGQFDIEAESLEEAKEKAKTIYDITQLEMDKVYIEEEEVY